jgi:signal peptidase
MGRPAVAAPDQIEMRDSGQMAGTRGSRPGSRPLGTLARFGGHVALLACWALVILMAVVTWGPHVSRFKTDIIVGRSMTPTIPLYSVIVVEPVAPESLRRGDVITFEEPDLPGRKVTHRIVEIEHPPHGGSTFVTKGDGNEARDPWRVTYRDSAYRVRWHAPHIGWLLLKSQTRLARVVLVVLPVLLLLVQFLRMVWRDESVIDAGDDSEWVDELDDDEWVAA